MEIGPQLHKVGSGRLFVRIVGGAPADYSAPAASRDRVKQVHLVLGIVELPKVADLERMHEARINSNLWINTHSAQRPSTYMGEADIRECDLGHLMTQVKFGASVIQDHGALFVRDTLIPHEKKSMRWAYVAGVFQKQEKVFPDSGVYEFDSTADGFRRIGTETYNGAAIGQVLALPIWGPGGKYGTRTSMEPETFHKWLAAERAKPPSAHEDPKFRAFVKMMQERCPELHVYDADQWAIREKNANDVLRELVAAETALEQAPMTAPRRARP